MNAYSNTQAVLRSYIYENATQKQIERLERELDAGSTIAEVYPARKELRITIRLKSTDLITF